MPTANEIRYMVMHPGPDREFAEWAKAKKLRWIGVDCGSADHPMNTIIRDWMPRQARQAEKVFQKKYGMPLAEFFDDTKYQLMHLEMFPYGIIHAECIGGEIDLLVNRRVTVGFFPWRFVDGEVEHRALRGDGGGRRVRGADGRRKPACPRPRFGDAYRPGARGKHQPASARVES